MVPLIPLLLVVLPALIVPKVQRVLVDLVLIVLLGNKTPPQLLKRHVTIVLPVNGPMLPLPKPTALLVALLVVPVKPVPSRTGMLNLNLLVALALTVKLPMLTFPPVLIVPKAKRVLVDLVPLVLPLKLIMMLFPPVLLRMKLRVARMHLNSVHSVPVLKQTIAKLSARRVLVTQTMALHARLTKHVQQGQQLFVQMPTLT